MKAHHNRQSAAVAPGPARRDDGGQDHDQLDERLQGWIADQHIFTHPQVSICWPPSLPRNDGLPGRPDKHRHHFDTDAVKRFLADVQDQQPARRPSGPPAAGR